MLITGDELELPLLIHASTVRTLAAERLGWHSHEGIELIFLLVGATTYEFERRRTMVLPGGRFLVVPAGTRHRGLHNVRMPVKLAGLTFDLRRTGNSSVVPFTRRELVWMTSRFAEAGGGVYPFGHKASEMVRELKAEMLTWSGNEAALAPKASLRTLICALILEAARELEEKAANLPSAIVAAAIEYLRNRVDEPFEMSALTKHLGFSRSRVFDLFTAETGLTPHNYLLRLRLERAMELLHSTDQSITAVALASGFGSGQHFSRVFRQYFGQTPCEHRHPRIGVPQRKIRARGFCEFPCPATPFAPTGEERPGPCGL